MMSDNMGLKLYKGFNRIEIYFSKFAIACILSHVFYYILSHVNS